MDDFDREVYCLCGLPFDAVDMAGAVARLREAAATGSPCFFSTPNLNFLISAQVDTDFRDSVIHSDLSIVDGMPLVWMARLLGLPIRERVAGASLFEALRADSDTSMKVYFFGGPDGVAEAACEHLNAEQSGLACVGFQSPGFVSVENMSEQSRLDAINASGADFLVVSLGARKGQEWIMRNLSRLTMPVISHLGAVVNFVAGTVSRAPLWMQRIGLEWLWRIKEEPALWKRYWIDGLGLLKMMLSMLLPHAFWLVMNRRRLKQSRFSCDVSLASDDVCRLIVGGAVPEPLPAMVKVALRQAAGSGRPIELDVTQAEYLGPGFFGQLLLLKKHLDNIGQHLHVVYQQDQKDFFVWNGVGYLLKPVDGSLGAKI